MDSTKLYYQIFKQLNNIPRPSHSEGQVADFLCRFADEHGLVWRRDKENCVVIEKPASEGYEDHEPVVILNHMDMVCVAEPGVDFDPLRSPIDAYIENDEKGVEWMKAHGTSLGADNGIGLSMALAILADDTLEHPALEVLTTTNEEDGMSGASQLAKDFIKGRRVVNLDSEAYDEITVGAAGALIQQAHLPFNTMQMPDDYVAYQVSVTGGQGGHSGVDIARGRGNAIKILANLLLVAVRQINIKLYIVNFNGGVAAASIPGNAEAKIIIPKDDVEDFMSLVAQCQEALHAEFHETDSKISLVVEKGVWHGSVVNEEGTHLLLAAINGIPVGPIRMHDTIEGTPMTSNNIGLVVQRHGMFDISTHTRSFDDKEMEYYGNEIRKILQLTGASVDLIMQAPAWQEDTEGELVQLTCQTFKDVLGFEPRKVAMHFVLEAGYFVETYPGLHIASIGPRILEPHSTNERVQIDTIDNIWKVTLELLKRL